MRGLLNRPSVPAATSVLAATSAREWGTVLGLLVVYELSSIRPILTANRAAGVPLRVGHVVLAAALDGTLWLLLLPIIFAVLDRTSHGRGPWVGRSLARVTFAIAAMAAQAGAFCAILVGTGRWSDVGVFARTSPLLGFAYQFETNVPPFLLIALVYVVLQRVHQARREREYAGQLQASLADARLHALAAELHPHFLFNSLNAIAALVRDEPDRAEAMLVKLSDLLRVTLGAGQPAEVALRAELERLAMYLDVQRMRLGARLTIHESIDPAALAAAVPTLVLQPLVENAITHGIAPRRGRGVLEIAAQRVGDRLCLTVRDDGVGIPNAGDRRDRVGLSNTRARLDAMYAGDYQLNLTAPAQGGTLVTITVPFRAVAAAPSDEPSQAIHRVAELRR